MVKCMLCGQEFKRITGKHLKYKHGITIDEYRALGGRTGVEKTCPICGEMFVPNNRAQILCSAECRGKYVGEKISGENHPNWGKHFNHTEETKRKISQNNACYWQDKKRPRVGKKIAAKLKGRPNTALKGRKFPEREPWNKGKKLPPEFGENVRRAMIEQGVIKSGPDNPSWKGGITPKTVVLRQSERYAEWRHSVFERDSYTCQICGQVGGKLVAHHIKRFADYPELRFAIENGITMCRSCHSRLHSIGYEDSGSISEVWARTTALLCRS